MIKSSVVLAIHWKLPYSGTNGVNMVRGRHAGREPWAQPQPNQWHRVLVLGSDSQFSYKRGHQLHLNTFFEICLQGNKNRMANASRLNTLTYPAIPFALSFWLQEKPGSWVAAPFPLPFHLPSRKVTFNLIIYITPASALRHHANTRSEGRICPKEQVSDRELNRPAALHEAARGRLPPASAWWPQTLPAGTPSTTHPSPYTLQCQSPILLPIEGGQARRGWAHPLAASHSAGVDANSWSH